MDAFWCWSPSSDKVQLLEGLMNPEQLSQVMFVLLLAWLVVLIVLGGSVLWLFLAWVVVGMVVDDSFQLE